TQAVDQLRVTAAGNEADVLAVRLGRRLESEGFSERARLRLGEIAEREAQELQLLARRLEEEVALVAREVSRAVQLRPSRPHPPAHIMARREGGGAELARGDEKIGELDLLIAAHARDRRLAARISVRKVVDDGFPETFFIVEDVMRNAEGFGDGARIFDVLA